MKSLLLFALALLNACCVMRRTVTDESGEEIYSRNIIEMPFESEATKSKQVLQTEEDLGYTNEF